MKFSITDSEWVILELLWEEKGLTIAQMQAKLAQTKGWSRHAIISFLKKMEDKGLVCYEEIGRAKHYQAVPDRTEVAMDESADFLNRVFKGKLGLMVSAMVEENQLSDDEVKELLEVLTKKDLQ